MTVMITDAMIERGARALLLVENPGVTNPATVAVNSWRDHAEAVLRAALEEAEDGNDR
jgi:hypothetical protein